MSEKKYKTLENINRMAVQVLDAFRNGSEARMRPTEVNRKVWEEILRLATTEEKRRKAATGRPPIQDESLLSQNPAAIRMRKSRARRKNPPALSY